MECTYIYHQDGEESPPNSSYIQSLFFIYPVFIAQLRRYIAPEYIPPESMFTEHSVCTVLCTQKAVEIVLSLPLKKMFFTPYDLDILRLDLDLLYESIPCRFDMKSCCQFSTKYDYRCLLVVLTSQ
jgi:hypothetical protein